MPMLEAPDSYATSLNKGGTKINTANKPTQVCYSKDHWDD